MAKADDVEITILYKEDDTNKKEKKVDQKLNINLDGVKVHSQNPYVTLEDASDDLEGSEVYNLGDGKVKLVLDCGDEFTINVEKAVSALLKASQLEVAEL